MAIHVAPFTTYRDNQKIVEDLLLKQDDGLVNILLAGKTTQ